MATVWYVSGSELEDLPTTKTFLNAFDNLEFFGATTGTRLIEQSPASGAFVPIFDPFYCCLGCIARMKVDTTLC